MINLQVFRYMSISKRMNSLWLTLARAASSLIYFAFGFIVICWGFAMWGNFIYAHALTEFHNVPTSFSTLMRLLLGDFNYPQLAAVRAACACGSVRWMRAIDALCCAVHCCAGAPGANPILFWAVHRPGVHRVPEHVHRHRLPRVHRGDYFLPA